MSPSEQCVYLAAGVGVRGARFLLPLFSDRTVGRLVRAIERLVFLAAGDGELTASLAEVADVFESGPPYTTTVRRILAGMEVEVAAGILAHQIKPSPYGVN